ncbi:MAG: hypothetical protein J2O48_02830 [Solirubrobacterales bacterium]|nr:hypothetical protein [Solirubrobacterales bacterium]
MAPIDQKQRVQRRVLELLADNGLPLPDTVEFGMGEVRFLWTDRKLVLIVELEDFDERDANGDFTLEGLGV